MADASVTFDTTLDPKGFQQGIKNINSGLNGMKSTLSGVAQATNNAFSGKNIANYQRELDKTSAKIEKLRSQTDLYEAQAAKLEAKPIMSEEDAAKANLLRSRIAEIAAEIERLEGKGEELRQVMGGAMNESPVRRFGDSLKNATKKTFGLVSGMKLLGKHTAQSGNAISNFGSRLMSLVKAAFVFNIVRRGLVQLRQYLGGLLKTNAEFTASLNSIKASLATAFQPIFQAILPALNALMSALATVMSYIAAFISLLFGKTLAQSKDSAKALNDQADALKGVGGAAASAKKELASFDQINQQAQDTASGGGGAGVGIDFSSVKEIDTSFLDRIWTALQPVINALERLWNSMAPFRTFVWQGLLDFYNLVLKPIGSWVLGEGLPRFIDGIRYFMEAVDWEKINGALERLWRALTPFVINVGEGLLWFYENVLVPIGIWVMGTLVPTVLDLITAALKALNTIVEILSPHVQWLWENFLVPFGEWTGEIIIKAITLVTGALTKFSDWAKENPQKLQTIFDIILAFLAALWVYYAVKNVALFITGTLIPALASLATTLLTVWLPIAALTVGIIALANVWDKLTPAQQTITLLGALAAAAIAAAIAIAVFHTAWSVGIAAAAIVGGLALLAGASYFSGKSIPGVLFSSEAGEPSMPSVAKSFSANNFSSSPFPALANGGLISPNNPRAVIVGDNTREEEIISPRSAIREEVMNAIEELGGIGGNQSATVILEVSGREFGRAVVDLGGKENARRGVRIKPKAVLA